MMVKWVLNDLMVSVGSGLWFYSAFPNVFSYDLHNLEIYNILYLHKVLHVATAEHSGFEAFTHLMHAR